MRLKAICIIISIIFLSSCIRVVGKIGSKIEEESHHKESTSSVKK
jgi:hypothetical protein